MSERDANAVRAERVLVQGTDSAGAIVLQVTSAGPEIAMIDDAGRKRIALTVNDSSQSINLYGQDDTHFARLVLDESSARVELCDEEGQQCVSLGEVTFERWRRIWKRLAP